MYTVLYLKWITNKDLSYSTWNSVQCYAPAWMGVGFGGAGIRVAESLHCSPEIITTLFISYTTTQNVFSVVVVVLRIFKRAEHFEFGTGQPEKGEDPRMECVLWILDREARLSASGQVWVGETLEPSAKSDISQNLSFCIQVILSGSQGKILGKM